MVLEELGLEENKLYKISKKSKMEKVQILIGLQNIQVQALNNTKPKKITKQSKAV